MGIVLSEVIVNRAFGQQGQRKIRERHTDHLGNVYFKSYIRDADFIDEADKLNVLSVSANAIDRALADQEIGNAIATFESGGDPLHVEVSPNNWQKVTPNYQTWEELAGGSTKDILSREDKLELVSLEPTITRISSQEKAIMWGTNVPGVSAVNTAIQEAINSKAELDAYLPFIVDGVF